MLQIECILILLIYINESCYYCFKTISMSKQISLVDKNNLVGVSLPRWNFTKVGQKKINAVETRWV